MQIQKANTNKHRQLCLGNRRLGSELEGQAQCSGNLKYSQLEIYETIQKKNYMNIDITISTELHLILTFISISTFLIFFNFTYLCWANLLQSILTTPIDSDGIMGSNVYRSNFKRLPQIKNWRHTLITLIGFLFLFGCTNHKCRVKAEIEKEEYAGARIWTLWCHGKCSRRIFQLSNI